MQTRVFGLVAEEGLWFSCRGGSLIFFAENGLWFGCRGGSLGLVAEEAL